MKEYGELQEVGDDGLTWANKTAQWIAYERMLESERPDALFNDPIAKYFAGDHGKRCSDTFSSMAGTHMFTDIGSEGFIQYHASRTKLISDHISKWISTTDGTKQVLNMGAGMDTRCYWD